MPARLEKFTPQQTCKEQAVPGEGANTLLGFAYVGSKLLCVVFRLSPELVRKKNVTGGSCQSVVLHRARSTWDWGPDRAEERGLHLLGGGKRRE